MLNVLKLAYAMMVAGVKTLQAGAVLIKTDDCVFIPRVLTQLRQWSKHADELPGIVSPSGHVIS